MRFAFLQIVRCWQLLPTEGKFGFGAVGLEIYFTILLVLRHATWMFSSRQTAEFSPLEMNLAE
ncbi:hypothetical protein BJX64DRAFT_269804 [Aspergillus heterothallicus]